MAPSGVACSALEVQNSVCTRPCQHHRRPTRHAATSGHQTCITWEAYEQLKHTYGHSVRVLGRVLGREYNRTHPRHTPVDPHDTPTFFLNDCSTGQWLSYEPILSQFGEVWVWTAHSEHLCRLVPRVAGDSWLKMLTLADTCSNPVVVSEVLQAAASKGLHPGNCQPSITRLPAHIKTAATTHNSQHSAGKRVVIVQAMFCQDSRAKDSCQRSASVTEVKCEQAVPGAKPAQTPSMVCVHTGTRLCQVDVPCSSGVLATCRRSPVC